MTAALGIAGGIGLLCFYSPAFWIGAVVSSLLWYSTSLTELCRLGLLSPGFRPPYSSEQWISSEVSIVVEDAEMYR